MLLFTNTVRIITKLFHMCLKHYRNIILQKNGFVNHFLKSSSDFCNISVTKHPYYDRFLYTYCVRNAQYTKTICPNQCEYFTKL